MNKSFKSTTLQETQSFSKEILSFLEDSNKNILTLKGELGAGKTTFTQAIGKNLKVEKNLKSPTFSIFKVYPTKNQKYKTICHIDAYRLENSNEIIELGILDYLNDSTTLTVIEWPQKINEVLQKFTDQTLNISIELGEDENERTFHYSS